MPLTVLESLAIELNEYIAQRIREISPGPAIIKHHLVIYPLGREPLVHGNGAARQLMETAISIAKDK